MSVSKPFTANSLMWMGVLLSALTGLLIMDGAGGSRPSPVAVAPADAELAQSVELAVEDRPGVTAPSATAGATAASAATRAGELE